MGGFNSGKHGNKDSTRGRNTLDARKWQRDRLMTPGHRFDTFWTRNGQPNGGISVIVNTDSVSLIYRYGGDTGQDMNYPVMIDWTPCHFGGQRGWWLCPVVGCGRRVAVLYSGKMFACRQCHRLAYQSTRTAPDLKPYERADKVRLKMGWCSGVANPPENKPKGMHWTTYLRLMQKLNMHNLEAVRSLDRLTARLQSKLAGFTDRLAL